MDTSTIISILQDVLADYSESKVLDRFAKYASQSTNMALKSRSANGMTPGSSSELQDAANRLLSGKTSKYGAIRRAALRELHIEQLVGSSLGMSILENVNSQTGISAAARGISTLNDQANIVKQDAESLLGNLERIGLMPDKFSTSCGLIVNSRVPDDDFTIEDAISNLHKWDIHLQMLMEVATGTKSSKKISKIENGSIQLTLELSGWSELALVAIAVICFYNSKIAKIVLHNMKNMVKDLHSLRSVPGFIEQEEKKLDENARNDAKKKIASHIDSGDEHRAKELKTSVDKAIDFIFDRASEGDALEAVIYQLPKIIEHNEEEIDSNLISLPEAIRLIEQSNSKAVESENTAKPAPPRLE